MNCPDCKVPWHWENMAGMTVFRTVGRRKVYRVRCPKCSRSADVNSRGKAHKETT